MTKKSTKTTAKKPTKGKKSSGFFISILKWLTTLIIWLTIIAGIVLAYFYSTLPDLKELEKANQKQIVHINYSNDSRIVDLGDVYKNDVKYYELPKCLIDAVVATEDRRFFEHNGVDIFGVMRAIYINLRYKKMTQGGSTITQQLAKFGYLSSEKTFSRKVREALLALELERQFTKEQILTIYFNRAYFGSGNYGISSAAKFYFNKSVSDLNLQQAATLVGILKAPSKLSPKSNPELAKKRKEEVIQNMFEAGFINKDEALLSGKEVNYQSDKEQELYFADYVYDQFPEFLAKNHSDTGNIYIKSTLSEEIQSKLEKVESDFIKSNSGIIGDSQISIIVMKKDGAILGMIGGKDYRKSQFNRAIYAKRQAGSVFKTFIYLQAFEQGFSPQDKFEDKKVDIGNWSPNNYKQQYFGEVTLERAFADSLNSVAIQLAQKIDKNKMVSLVKKLGITGEIDKKDLTIALGSNEVTLFELTLAYAAIANEGAPVLPYAITEIADNKNNVLYQRQSSKLVPVVTKQSVDRIKELLLQVVKTGTGKKAGGKGNICGKTGTSQNFRDAWFVGFNDDYVIGIWIGNDDNSPTNKITGGSLPAEFFAKLISDL